jgi:hypothetical protein
MGSSLPSTRRHCQQSAEGAEFAAERSIAGMNEANGAGWRGLVASNAATACGISLKRFSVVVAGLYLQWHGT